MKKYNHPIDDFFREALKDHQMTPSEASKKSFLENVMKGTQSGQKSKKGLILLSVFLILVVAGIFLLPVISDKTTPVPVTGPIPVSRNSNIADHDQEPAVKKTPEDKGKSTSADITVSTTQSPQVNHPIVNPSIQSAIVNRPILNSSIQSSIVNPPIVNPSIQPSIVNRQIVNPSIQSSIVNPPIVNPVIQSSIVNPPIVNPVIQSEIVNRPTVNPAIQSEIVNPPIVNPLPVTATMEEKKVAPVKSPGWIPSIGVYYTPEWMFNTLEGTKFVNNLGIEGTFHFGRFSVRTGGGLSVAQGTNEVIVEYNDYLGAYNKLDSMDFTWNPPAQQFIPKFYMSNQEVWDSLMKLDYARVVKRYTYLQIPLIMGYDFWQSDRISIGVRTGPVLSVLLDTKQLSAPYDPGQKRIISINDIAPGQADLNWQVMAGINASIRLTGTLQFDIEPSVRYYFNSVYEKPVNNAKPWSVGVRAAFLFKL